MKRLTLTALLLVYAVAGAQTLTLTTWYGPAPANADRVLVSGEDGQWQRVEGAGGTYLLKVAGERYSLAVTCFGAEGPTVTVYRFQTNEVANLQHTCAGNGDVLAAPTRVTGELLGPAPAGRIPNLATLHLGPWQLYAGPLPAATQFSAAVPAVEGMDMLALLSTPGAAPSRAVLQRQANPSGAPAVLDFGGSAALELEHHELAVVPSERASLEAWLHTCGGIRAAVGAPTAAGSQRSTYAALPQGAGEECDRYELTAFSTDQAGSTLRLTTRFLAEPTDAAFVLPADVGLPTIETVGTDPLRARFTWQPEQDALFYIGTLTDGRVTWNFVQSATLPPAITLTPWGADAGVPDLRGGDFTWGFGAARSASEVEAVLRAYQQRNLTDGAVVGVPVPAGLSYELFLTGGAWAPHAGALPGSR